MPLNQKQAKTLHTATKVAGTAAQIGLCFVPGAGQVLGVGRLAALGIDLAAGTVASKGIDKVGYGLQHQITKHTQGYEVAGSKIPRVSQTSSEPAEHSRQPVQGRSGTANHVAGVSDTNPLAMGLAGAGLAKAGPGLLKGVSNGMQSTNSNGRSLGNTFSKFGQNVGTMTQQSDKSLQEDFAKNGVGVQQDAQQEALSK